MTDMSVGVDETRRDEATRGIENSVASPRVCLALSAHVTDPAVEKRDLHAVENFSGVNVDDVSRR